MGGFAVGNFSVPPQGWGRDMNESATFEAAARIAKAEDEAEAKVEAHKAALSRFPIVRIGTIEARSPNWYAYKFLEQGAHGETFGESGACKSFLVLDLGLSGAAGIDWHGRAVKQGPVIYICAEGRSGVIRRVKAWSIARKVDVSNIPFFITNAVNLTNPETMETVRLAVGAVATEAGPPKLLIVDTWAGNLGADENSTPDTEAGISALDALCGPYNAAGLIVHHVGQGNKERARGAYALLASLDMEYRVERGSDEMIRVTCTKAKDIEPPEPMAFKLSSVDLGILDEKGDPVTSAVLTACDYEPEKGAKGATGKWQKSCLEVLRTLIKDREANLEKSGRSASEARVSATEWKEAAVDGGTVPKTRFYEAKKTLIESGVVVLDGYHVSLS